MKQNSVNMSCFKAMCVLSLILISQAQAPLALCPATDVEKRNVLVQTPVTLPPAMNYQYSSPALFGTEILELTARVEGQKLFLSVLKPDWKVYEQSKTYPTPVEIVGVRSHHVFVKIFSADKSSFTYEVLLYDETITTVGESPVNPAKVKALTGIPAGGEIKNIIYYQHPTKIFVLISTATYGTMYEILVTTGAVTLFRNFATPIFANIEGSSYFCWQATTKKFYNFSFQEENLNAALTAANAVWYPETVQVHTVLYHDVGMLSTDAASKKGTFIHYRGYKVPAHAIHNVGGGDVLPRIYSDNLLNIVVYSDKVLYWFSFLAVGGLSPTSDLIVNKKVGEGIDSAITDFSTALGVSTNSQTAFLITTTGFKYYKLEKKAGQEVATVTKIGETLLPETVAGSFGNKLIAVTIKCECATNSAPKLICFSSTLNCLMVTSKAFTDCTVTA